VNIKNVASWAELYSLPQSMRCHAASRPSLLSNDNTKAQLFHAHLGAVFLEERMLGAENWIRSLMNYQIKHQDEETSTDYDSVAPDTGVRTPTASQHSLDDLSSHFDDATTLVQDSNREYSNINYLGLLPITRSRSSRNKQQFN
jgi:hypothetical protein